MALVQRFALVSADVVTVVSESLKASVEARFPSVRAHVAPMGIDSEVFHPSRYHENLRRKYAPDGQMILFVGFLVEVKGVDTLLRAFQLLAPAFPKAQLDIVGDGQERSALAGLATELGLANRVCFAGALPQAELAAFHATADAFVGPSRHEGFRLVFAEAMCSGSLVIRSDIPPLRQFITPGIAGWLATPDDRKRTI